MLSRLKKNTDDEEVRHGLEARADWRGYHSVAEETDPRYHSRPDCEDGKQINEEDIREGTAGRPMCDKCRASEHPVK